MSWLVTGGAGYIGAHVVRALTAVGADVVVLDNLSTGVADRVRGVPLVVGSLLDSAVLGRVVGERPITGIVHLAGKKQVSESVAKPLEYYEENIEGLRRLLTAVVDADIRSFVFSSSAAVYGSPDVAEVTEQLPCRPVNPYGRTKLAGEWMIEDVARATGISFANLRYFNVAGAAEPALADTTVANLVTQVFDRIAVGRAPQIFGDDYPTPDGTCVRDFVHVADVASAHVAAASALAKEPGLQLTLNLGRGQGASVREVCTAIEQVVRADGIDVHPPVITPRRPGDPPRVVASAEAAGQILGWRAEYNLTQMVTSAWAGWRALQDRRASQLVAVAGKDEHLRPRAQVKGALVWPEGDLLRRG